MPDQDILALLQGSKQIWFSSSGVNTSVIAHCSFFLMCVSGGEAWVKRAAVYWPDVLLTHSFSLQARQW